MAFIKALTKTVTRVFLGLILLLSSSGAFAGGLECQTNGTCQCRYDGACDKYGNPTTPRPVILCGDRYPAMSIYLGQHFEEMPSEGRVPAAFRNVALPLHGTLTTFNVQGPINPRNQDLLLRRKQRSRT